MFDGIYHVGYWTDDLGAAVKLYQTVFGGEVFQEDVAANGNRLAYLHDGKTDVELIEPADKSVLGGQTGVIIHHVGYLVPDIEAAMAELRAKGVTFQTEAPYATATGARIIYLNTDSAGGARIHLSQI